MLMDEMLKRPWLELMFKYNQTRLEQQEWVKLSYDQRKRYQISMWDLQYDVDVFVDSGLFGGFSNQQVGLLMEMYQTFAADPETSQVLRKPQFVRDMLYLGGMPSTQRHTKSDEEIALERQQAIAQANEQMAMEASLQQAGAGAGSGAAR